MAPRQLAEDGGAVRTTRVVAPHGAPTRSGRGRSGVSRDHADTSRDHERDGSSAPGRAATALRALARLTTRLPLLASLCLAIMSTAYAAIEAREFQSLEEEQRFRTLAEEIRCLVCQNQSLADSGAGLATDLRDEILRLMREGKSNAEIKAFLTARYGDFVLYRPPVKPGTWALWFGPVAMVLVGGAIVAATIRRRSRGEALVPDPEQQELDRRLAELDPDALPADELHPPARSTPASAPSARFAAGEPPPRPSDDGPPGDDPAAAHEDVAPSGNDRLERDDPIGPRDEETPR